MRAHLCLILLALASHACGESQRLSPEDDWFAVLSGPSLQPGDEIVLAAGTYADPRRLEISHRGSAERPITIRGEAAAKVKFERPDRRQNSFNLSGCQHLILKDLEITGGDAAIRIGGRGDHPAKFITLENLHIHHIGGVAITANYPGERYQSLTFRHNHIHHTGGHGEAFYLGGNNKADGSVDAYIFDSIIENNYIHDLRGDAVSQGDGIELKDGSYNNIIRDNVIHDTNYPGIIVYGSRGKAPNIIERNAIWATGDHGIQAAADAIIRNNVIYRTAGDGIHCRDHQGAVVGGLTIVHNTVIGENPIRIVAPERFSGRITVANNAFGGTPRIPSSPEITRTGNCRGTTEMFPPPGSACIGRADPTHLSDRDFNSTARGGARDAGAYKFDPAGNPGWRISEGFKR
ncbi:MAG: right-handed parallel beta-helix repeat-containing protein [Verrucomicrobiales bacterium]